MICSLRNIGRATGILVASTALYSTAIAQDFPERQLTLVVGFSPGGQSDAGARGIAPHWEETLGVPVIVDNRPGAGMQIALEYAWAQPHDGHTVMWHNQQYLSALEAVDPDLPYATDEWLWLEVLENDPAVITVRSDAPWQSLDELVEDMRERPDEITLGLLVGSVQLLGCKTLFEDILDVEFREVPQTSGAPMRSSLVGGHVDVICTNAVGSHALGDDVNAFSVFNDNGSQLLPDAQPINEYLASIGSDERIPSLGSLRGAAVPRTFAEENPEAFDVLYESYKAAVDSEGFQSWLDESGRDAVVIRNSIEEAQAMIAEYNAFFLDNKDVFLGE